MDRLWSPWRSKYIESFSEEDNGNGKPCVFCEKLSGEDDTGNLVVCRSELSAIIMNIYPYNSGHLMVVPFKHASSLDDLTNAEEMDIMQQIKTAVKILTSALHPDGFNIGVNLGRVAGAGIADHIHYHIVPRWEGDTNFMPVLADTKVISEDMSQTLVKLRKALSETG
ncbi:MAG: HIT family protein [Candidatus Kryptoniota bacterium]